MSADTHPSDRNRLRGYDKFIREELLLYKELGNDKEYIFYLLLVHCIADWDPRHDNVGCFHFDVEHIADMLNWKKELTSRVFRRFVKKGYVIEINKQIKLYKVAGYETRFAYVKEKNHSFGDYIKLLKDAISPQKDKGLVEEVDTAPLFPAIYRDNIISSKVGYGVVSERSALTKEDEIQIDKVLQHVTS